MTLRQHTLTDYVASNENVTSHNDSVLKDIQRASEEEAMEFEELISEINDLTNKNDCSL